jgi:ABC-type nitrate/sulfonate/bicarbonate transport system substrate-binding protein
MALDSLEEQGYTVEIVNFARSDLIVEALQRGDLDVGVVNPNVVWVAISRGADLRTISSKTNATYRVVARREIRACHDLDGRSVAFNTTQATNKAMFDAYVRRRCPSITPRIVVIGDSANRLVALQAGEIDSAMLEVEEWLYLEDRAPGRFHVVADVAQEFSDIRTSSLAVRTEWAKQNPEKVKDFLRTLLTMYRHVVENPHVAQEESVRRLSLDAASAKRLTDAFLASNVWDVNGSLTEANVQTTIDFLAREGSVPAGLKAEDVADLTYLNAVLDEIGRR